MRAGNVADMGGASAERPPYLTRFRSDVFWWEPDGRVVRASPGDGIYFMSCVHPDGDHVVFWGGTEGRPRIWIADGTGAFDAVTDGTRSARFPAYSLDGRFLAYTGSSHPSEVVERFADHSSTARPLPGAGLSIVVRRTEDGR